MPKTHAWSAPVHTPLPMILIRGFGGLDVEEERKVAYQGFNTGSVYPQRRGENYIYEGFILRLMKSKWRYDDATNVVGYFGSPVADPPHADALKGLTLPEGAFHGDKIVLDAAMARRFHEAAADPLRTFWIFRYYDLSDRKFDVYGRALVRLIELIRALCALKTGTAPKVNIVAHSMGGLIVREAVQRTYGAGEADAAINKIVTLGTPHKGISFQLLRDLRWLPIEAENEIRHFNPAKQADKANRAAAVNFGKHFPLERLLCVVGTDYRTYSVRASSFANRVFPVPGEHGFSYNRSDGLVKQANALIDGAPRTFVHKCHGGGDSLMTARESYEVATRFFFGDVRARLRLVRAKVKRKFDVFGRDEIFFGVSIKPRRVDFDLFHQSSAAENSYGPFRKPDLSDTPAFPWAGPDRLIWEGFLDSGQNNGAPDLVLRADVFVSERDSFGIGFSDNVVYRKQLYVRAVLRPRLQLELHFDEDFQDAAPAAPGDPAVMAAVGGGWEFDFGDASFEGRLRVELEWLRAPEPATAPADAGPVG